LNYTRKQEKVKVTGEK